MSFFTAVSLSLNNLLTKKGRTLLTSFAGSIGIIGIALILSLSTGINNYINAVQEETLSSYPINIMRESTDLSGMFGTIMERHETDGESGDKAEQSDVKANTDIYEVFNAFNSSAKQTNNMKAFKEYIETDEDINSNASAIAYSYNTKMPIFTKDINDNIIESDLMKIMSAAGGMENSSMMNEYASMMETMGTMDIWEEMLPSEDGSGVSEILINQYDLVYGNWPQNYNEVVLVLSRRNQLPDIVMYTLA